MIELRHISKTFRGKRDVHAVKDVSLTVEEGDIFGVIGFSGAGKSTLVRCINLLEWPDSGEVLIKGRDITKLRGRELRVSREDIGMIFQHFNLFRSRTVGENIAFPLQYRGQNRSDMARRVKELLELVGLEDKADVYPSQLSGGQKQRVGIARALASKPAILLCDEGTSALDPQTTQSILALLRRLNNRLNLTMVIITHEMPVIKAICTHAAVMEAGRIIEQGAVFDIFSNPREQITREFIETTSNLRKIHDLLEYKSSAIRLGRGQILARFSYVGRNTIEPLISGISINFNLKINIIFADIDIVQETPIGGLVNIIEGEPERIEQAIQWMGEKGVRVEVLKHG
ncbi:MAG: ATP-binding cassette domain-containing protein [Spirochaetaceae bacterium]|jgi:D-methionine transport system ATP-binding protein|nr:ATP-binding cassette domain-containing protein [Spirochaetaceae bacterium]